MLGSRMITICFLILFIAANAGLILQSGLNLQQAIAADRTRIEQSLPALLQAKNSHPALYAHLQQMAPIHYLFIGDQSLGQRDSFGQYQDPSHLFAPLLTLFPASLDVDYYSKPQELELQLQLDGDHYLAQISSALIPLFALFSALLLLCLATVRWQLGRAKQQFAIFQAGIERLPTFELPNAMTKLTGPWQTLGTTLEHSLGQIKHQFAEFNQKKSLQTHSVFDLVTGLKTRTMFEDELVNPQDPHAVSGYLILLRGKALAQINERLGNTGGDNYLNEIGKLLKQTAAKFSGGVCYRYGATDFLLKLPASDLETAQIALKTLSLQLEDLAKSQEVNDAGVLGAIAYKKQDHISTLLTSLDTAVSMAESQGANEFYLMDTSLSDLGLDTDQWLSVIQDVIANARLRFIHQKIRSTNENVRLYTELLVRLQNESGHPLPTGSTFNMAARHGLAIELDKLVITCLFRELSHDRDPNKSYGINLANHSFCDPDFMQWLDTRLQDQPELANRLIFEINERSIQQNANQACECIERLHRVGTRICIENFGTALTSFRLFQMLKPDYIKLEPSLTRGIETDTNNQFFIRMLLELAERMSIKVIAAHVEMADEKVSLEALGIHGLQGHYISMPEAVDSVLGPAPVLS